MEKENFFDYVKRVSNGRSLPKMERDLTGIRWHGPSPRPMRNTVITKDDITNLKILVNQFNNNKITFEEFLERT